MILVNINLQHLNFNRNRNEKIYITLLAILIGTLTGFGAVGVHHIIDFFQNLFYGKGNPLELFTNATIWQILLIPLVVGVGVGLIIYFIAPETKGSGIPDVMASVMLRGGKIRLRVAFSKTLTCSLSIGSGASLGSEGPQAQIGASLSSNIARFFLKKEDYIKILVAAGAGSGIAAAFNAPMAGALFAAGFLSLLFIWILYYSEYFFDKILKIPFFFKTAIGGLIVGLIGIFYPQVMGVGFDVINETLNDSPLYWTLIITVFFKIVATSATLGSGHSGGVFVRSNTGTNCINVYNI